MLYFDVRRGNEYCGGHFWLTCCTSVSAADEYQDTLRVCLNSEQVSAAILAGIFPSFRNEPLTVLSPPVHD
jgi:hypothetical protein